MSTQLWWHLSRASGIVAWLFITASVLWGILLSSRLFPKHRRPAWLLDLHRWLSALGLVGLAVHLGSLVADTFVHFGIADLLVPFASSWKTWQVALGVIAMWGLVVVEVSSLLMRRLPRRLWKGLHMTSYLVFVLSSLHGTFAGTDATNRLYLGTTIVTTLAVVVLVSARIIVPKPPVARRTRHLVSDTG